MKDHGITIGVDIMDMSISWECSIYSQYKFHEIPSISY